MGKCVLITGATSGIGKATAEILAENGYNLILTGRRKEYLEQLKEDLFRKYGQTPLTLNFDVRDLRQVEESLDSLPHPYNEIDVLVNNAGLAVGLNAVQDGVTDDWDRMIDTNVKGLLYVTRKVIPGMISRKSGHIINISSIAGKDPYPMGNVYCATKHAVQSLTQTMRMELLPYGIKVSSVAPGAVNTEFSTVRFKGDRERADNVYKGFIPLSGKDVAEAILFIISRAPHVNIDDLLIMPTAQAFSRDISRK